ncbi:MAG: type IX secretion system membrane protein PorP/SprF [Flavobacteriales bacterium]
MKKTVLKITVGILAVLTTATFSEVSAQQDAQYSMYMFNPLSINPAYAGSRDALSITSLGRNQWVNIDGAPTTATLSIHTPLRYEAVSLGLSLIQDQIGPTKTTGIYADVSYRFQVSKNSRLSFGLKGGTDIFSADFGNLRVRDESDEQYFTPIQNQLMPNFGFGVYLHSDDYYVGLTAPKIIKNQLEGATVNDLASTQDRHFFLTAGKTFKVNSVIDVVPSFIAKAVEDAPLSLDVNVNFMFYDKLWIGGGYRFGDSFIGNIVYHFTPQFRAGYAYDYTTSELSNYNTGSHEIMINYDLDFLGKGFKTPRRF